MIQRVDERIKTVRSDGCEARKEKPMSKVGNTDNMVFGIPGQICNFTAVVKDVLHVMNLMAFSAGVRADYIC